ncbi:hypothetical protein WG66_005333 [Moniliophthora roreri]|nr:hypothetical protein WG66_005333 [Moniliophthora roreri]
MMQRRELKMESTTNLIDCSSIEARQDMDDTLAQHDSQGKLSARDNRGINLTRFCTAAVWRSMSATVISMREWVTKL